MRRRLRKVDEQLAQLNEIKCVLESGLSCCPNGCDCPRCRDLEQLQRRISTNLPKTA